MFMSQFFFNEGLTAMTLETITLTNKLLKFCTGFFTGVSEFIASGANSKNTNTFKSNILDRNIYCKWFISISYIGTAGPVIFNKTSADRFDQYYKIIPAYNPVLLACIGADYNIIAKQDIIFVMVWLYCKLAWTVGTVGGLYVSPLRNSNAIKVFGARF